MTDGPLDAHILGTLDRDGLGDRIIRGRETAETLTCLSLAILWDDPERNHFDCPWDWRDQYARERERERIRERR